MYTHTSDDHAFHVHSNALHSESSSMKHCGITNAQFNAKHSGSRRYTCTCTSLQILAQDNYIHVARDIHVHEHVHVQYMCTCTCVYVTGSEKTPVVA